MVVMQVNRHYFQHYSEAEEEIMRQWIENTVWIPKGTTYVRSNTPFHDGLLILPDGCQCLVEVKVDEAYWYTRTGNIAIDYISAFEFKSPQLRIKFCDSYRRWVNPSAHQHFLESIFVHK